MSEPWFDHRTAGLVGGGVGSLVGLWGAVVGTLSGLLIPRCRGRVWLFGLLWAGLGAGLTLTGVGAWAVLDGQPFHVCHAFLLTGLLTTVLSAAFLPITGRRYRLAEEQRMARQDAV